MKQKKTHVGLDGTILMIWSELVFVKSKCQISMNVVGARAHNIYMKNNNNNNNTRFMA